MVETAHGERRVETREDTPGRGGWRLERTRPPEEEEVTLWVFLGSCAEA